VSLVFVGNDVVDLATPRTAGRASDARFVARVFDADEQATIHAAGGSDVELWSRWAAKEAGFKAVSKVIGGQPSFLHKTFKVTWSDPLDAQKSGDDPEEAVVREGSVRHGDHLARVTVRMRPGVVHAVAVCAPHPALDTIQVRRRVARLADPAGGWNGPLDQLMALFSDREADAVRSLPSAAVRIGARADLAEVLGVPQERVEIVCDPGPVTRRPPRVLVDGDAARADVSLSHDGEWIAWAIWVGA
jgi:phosphopantetheine--protein transferase-like protein